MRLALLALFSFSALAQEHRKVVAIVDTGISSALANAPFMCKGLSRDFTGYGLNDAHGHGTNITGLVLKGLNPKTHCVAMLKFWHLPKVVTLTSLETQMQIILNYIKYLEALKPAYINLSVDGPFFVSAENALLKSLTKSGTRVLVAAGNQGLNLKVNCNTYPACYPINSKNFYVVSSNATFANKNGPVNATANSVNQCAFNICLSGTSQATANKTADLLRKEKN